MDPLADTVIQALTKRENVHRDNAFAADMRGEYDVLDRELGAADALEAAVAYVRETSASMEPDSEEPDPDFGPRPEGGLCGPCGGCPQGAVVCGGAA